MRKNVELVKSMREKVGPDFPLMIDCYMALSVSYTIQLAKKIEPYNIKVLLSIFRALLLFPSYCSFFSFMLFRNSQWIEETLPPDNYSGYTELREKITSTMITTGLLDLLRSPLL